MKYGKANRALEAVALKEGVPVQEVIKRIEEAMEEAVFIAKESNDRHRLAFWEELRSHSGDSPAAALIDCLSRRILNEK